MRLLRGNIAIGLAGILLLACDGLNWKSMHEEEDAVVASIGKNMLHKSELAFLGTGGSPADSARLADRYLQNWLKKHLMIQEAEKMKVYDEAELNRKLLDYKYALMVYEFEKAYIEANLDRQISDDEILAYYHKHRENFTLKEIIVRLSFVKIEKDLSQKSKIEDLLKGSKSNPAEDLHELTQRFASNYFLEDSTWVKFDDIILNTPLQGHPNKVQLLRQNNIIKVDDDTHTYYFRIIEYKLGNQVPPMEFVRDEISQIIQNKRKVALAEELQKNIYNRALEHKEFKIYELH